MAGSTLRLRLSPPISFSRCDERRSSRKSLLHRRRSRKLANVIFETTSDHARCDALELLSITLGERTWRKKPKAEAKAEKAAVRNQGLTATRARRVHLAARNSSQQRRTSRASLRVCGRLLHFFVDLRAFASGGDAKRSCDATAGQLTLRRMLDRPGCRRQEPDYQSSTRGPFARTAGMVEGKDKFWGGGESAQSSSVTLSQL